MSKSRRKFLKNSLLLAVGGMVGIPVLKSFSAPLNKEDQSILSFGGNTFTLPQLPYAYDALEPAIDKMTMEIHHSKHHQAYVDNLNKALNEKDSAGKSLEEILKKISKQSVAVRNNGGGHWNHSFFWKIMKPGGGKPEGKLADAINSNFNSFEEFKTKFNEAAKSRVGCGGGGFV